MAARLSVSHLYLPASISSSVPQTDRQTRGDRLKTESIRFDVSGQVRACAAGFISHTESSSCKGEVKRVRLCGLFSPVDLLSSHPSCLCPVVCCRPVCRFPLLSSLCPFISHQSPNIPQTFAQRFYSNDRLSSSQDGLQRLIFSSNSSHFQRGATLRSC